MKIEHIAFNVAAPVEVAAWYIENLGMKVVRSIGAPTFTHFLADETGTTIIEIYNNPADQVPDYAAMNPLIFHLAFASENPATDSRNLAKNGAIPVEELHLDDGSHLIMMRDPWGLAIQLCKRGVPLLK
jgi:catechol 2,3-dioxygenase-like lactoylglutathione lyase family enzyme